MLKKLFFCVCFIFLFFANSSWGQSGGQVVLDLREDKEFEHLETNVEMDDIISFSVSYFKDVKEYSDLLTGSSINKDFTNDIMSKYPNYSKKTAEQWQKYVRKGVRIYRWFEYWKNKAVSWVMDKELPIVVDDNQYEMGESEEYVESDNPVIIHDFKKVVAYSNSERDRLAAKEKYARDNNLIRPSELIKRYKKALVEKDWTALLGVEWHEFVSTFTEQEGVTADGIKNNIVAAVLTEKDGVEDGKIEGVVLIKPQEDGILLLGEYGNYKGLDISFEGSENIENISVSFVMPQLITVNKYQDISGYLTKFPVYFSGKVVDRNQKIKIKANVKGNICSGDNCREITVSPETVLIPKNETKDTPFASYIRTVKLNIPSERNAKEFEFGKLVLEKGKAGKTDNIRIDIGTDDAVLLKMFIVGNEAKYFSKPRLRIDNDKVVARFDLLNQLFDPTGKEITFWVYLGSNKQYLYTAKVEEVSVLDIENGSVSLGILGLAFLGGLMLNLMPCVFPVLSLKLLAFTKFGGLNKKQIRTNFIYNSLGILVSFLMIAMLLMFLKIAGYMIGWGMQFQNIYFLVIIIWVVVLFFAHILGIVNLRMLQIFEKVTKTKQVKGRVFEFLSGVFLVLLSTPCVAPYLGTAFGVALSGSVYDILVTVLMVGVGLAMPYISIAVWPQLALYMPKPGKWMNTFNNVMVFMLILTICWLISLLVAQTSFSQLWHWLGYVITFLISLSFRKTLLVEVDKLDRNDFKIILKRRFNIVFAVIVLILMSVSMFDAVWAADKRKTEISQTKMTMLDTIKIDDMVAQGHKVLVKVGADWCLTCKYNDIFAFNVEHIQDALVNNNVNVIEIDWTNYQAGILNFMQKFGRRGLPFYVLFSSAYPDGIVLPEIIDVYELQTLMEL